MSKRTLLIEDNLQNSYLATYLLEKNGFQVVHATDGAKALEIAKNSHFDLILLDIQLPSMDGYSVASALRELESTYHIPIIAVTSYAMVGDKEKAVAAGCDGYIEKPIDPDRFINEIENIIEISKAKEKSK